MSIVVQIRTTTICGNTRTIPGQTDVLDLRCIPFVATLRSSWLDAGIHIVGREVGATVNGAPAGLPEVSGEEQLDVVQYHTVCERYI